MCDGLLKQLYAVRRLRGSILACCSICGAIAEEAQPVPNYKELIYTAVKSAFVDPTSVGPPNEFVARAARPAPRHATGRDAAVCGASAPRPLLNRPARDKCSKPG
jgi:hypothetical protein